MHRELIREIVRGFIGSSNQCINELVKHLAHSEKTSSRGLFIFRDGRRKPSEYEGHFFLRASTEYSNPQLTLEDLQGIQQHSFLQLHNLLTLSLGCSAD